MIEIGDRIFEKFMPPREFRAWQLRQAGKTYEKIGAEIACSTGMARTIYLRAVGREKHIRRIADILVAENVLHAKNSHR